MNEQEIEPTEIIVRIGRRIVRAPHRPGETVLETLRRAEITIPTQCEQAYCGSCAFELLQGEIILKLNEALSEQDLAGGMRLACQGVPRGETVEIQLY